MVAIDGHFVGFQVPKKGIPLERCYIHNGNEHCLKSTYTCVPNMIGNYCEIYCGLNEAKTSTCVNQNIVCVEGKRFVPRWPSYWPSSDKRMSSCMCIMTKVFIENVTTTKLDFS